MSPFDVVCATNRPSRADKTRLVESSRRIEARALTLPAGTTMWVSLQRAAYLSARTEWVYRTVAKLGITVHLYAPDPIEIVGAPDTLHTHVSDGPCDWAVLLLGERAGWGLVARDRSRHDEPDDRRAFDWAVTRDRVCLAAAAGTLTSREPVLLSSASGSSSL